MAETKIKTLKVSQSSTIGGPSAIHTIQGESVTLKYTADPLPPAGQTKVELDNTHVIMTAGLGKEVSIDDSDVNIQHGTAIKITTDSSNGLTVDTTGVKVNVPFVLTNITDQNILVTDSSGNVVSSGKPTPDIYKSEVAEITGHLQSQIDYISGGGLSGLTPNYIPYALSSTTLGDSTIRQVGANVRIGSQYVDHDTSNDTTLQGYSDTTGEYILEAFQTSAGSNKYNISLNKYGGKVGIGTSPAGAEALQVGGAFKATLADTGSPYVSVTSSAANPYIESQRWSGVSTDYFGVRLLNKGVDGFRIQTHGASTGIEAQTFLDRLIVSTTGQIGVGMDPTNTEALQISGAIKTTGGAAIGQTTLDGYGGIELAAGGTGNRYALIDFHGDDVNTDYALRIIRDNAGENANSSIVHRGTGALELIAQDAGYLVFKTSNAERMRIANDGPVAIGGSVLQAAAGAWGPHLVVGADENNKLICGYVTSSSNMVTVGGHSTTLGAWTPIQVAGTEVNLSYQETPVLRVGNAKVGVNRQATTYAFEIAGNGHFIGGTTPAIPGATDVLIGNGKIYAGDVILSYRPSTSSAFVTGGTAVITGNVTDGSQGGITLQCNYNGAYTVTRHNFINLIDQGIGGGGTITDACAIRFFISAGTHRAISAGTTKATPGTVDKWIKMNIQGVLHYVPAYTSMTS